MVMSKIPASYHLKRMVKSEDSKSATTHYLAFWNQMFMVSWFNAIAYQKAMAEYVDKLIN
jgi:hypothetical protein